MVSQESFVIIGAGLAGATAAAHLREEGFDGRIVLVGEERERPYERPALSKGYLRGAVERPSLDVHDAEFYGENEIDLRTAVRAIGLEPKNREIVLDDGDGLRYHRLLLATGAEPRRLRVSGNELPGVYYLRTVDDADALCHAAASARRAVVIGGGWIGAEVAASLRQLGLPVAMVVSSSLPLEKVLGVEVSTVYRDLHAAHGVELMINQRVVALIGKTTVAGVETAGGTRIEGDLVVVGIGAEPRTTLAASAGLDVGNGIAVDQYLETSAPGVFAAGDVAAAWHPLLGSRIRVEHWDNARRQGAAAARNMLGRADPYVRLPYFYSDQYNLSMEYVGYAPEWDRVVFRGEPASGAFVAFWLRDGLVLAGMSANVWQVNDAIAALVRARKRVSIERLADPTVPLADLDALLLPAEAVRGP